MDGTPFGRYRLLDLLGRGGMGEVWRAYDTETERVVALKLLPEQLSRDEEFERRFRREAHAAARLNSPHVIPIHHYGAIEGRLYVDMRLVDGHDLQSELTGGPLEPARAVRIIDQVARALHAAHRVGLLHRDIKPSNILLDSDDFAYLIDFGISRAADDTRMTKSGNTIGTFAYIAPERLDSSSDEDARADVYSLACVLYEALTGDPPFPGTTTAHLIAAHLHTPPPRPSIVQPNVPAQIDRVIATGMAKDREERYVTTVELATAARDAITVPIERPTPVAPSSRTTQVIDSTVVDDASLAGAAPTLIEDTGDLDRGADGTGEQPTQLEPTQQEPPSTEPPQAPPEPPPAPARSRRTWIIAAVVVLAAAGTFAIVGHQTPHQNPASQAGSPSQTASPQVVLPFAGLNHPDSATVDTAGDVYVADGLNDRVLKLAAGDDTQSELPFVGLNQPWDVATDTAGNVYVADHGNNRVLKLPTGANAQTELPFTGLGQPWSVAVDALGNVFVTDATHNRVLKLAAAANTSTVLPSAGLNQPRGLAVDTPGNVYVTDIGNRVLKLAAGADAWTELPFSGLYQPEALAVDSAGNLYVADSGHNRVVKLAAGATTQTVLPFAGLDYPDSVAVDHAGAVYVTDWRNNRVLKLPAR